MNRDAFEVEQTFEALARNGRVLTASGVAEWPDETVSGCYAFQHALYQEVLYQRLAPGQRVQTHRRLGERLEQGYEDRTEEIAAVLAHYFEEGRDAAKAVRYLRQAAASAAKRFGNREAAIYLTRALGLVDRLPSNDRLSVRAELLHVRGWICRSGGDLAGALGDLHEMIACAADAKNLRLEVSGLLDLSRFSFFADRRHCLEIAQRALVPSDALDDEVFKAVVQGSSANLNLILRGWRHEDDELCRQALKVTAEAREPSILLRRCAIESNLAFMNANYLGCCEVAAQGKTLAQAMGDTHVFALFNLVESFGLLHVGEWGKLRQGVTAALTLAERNANQLASAMCRLMIAWLHAEAFDYEGARARCEATLDRHVEANPLNFFIGRNLLAKAYIGLCDYPAALNQFNEITRRIDVDGIAMDWTLYTQFYHNLCEYSLWTGDLTRAREQAARLYEIAAGPQEGTYLALASRLLARIAIAEEDLAEARLQLGRAISVVERAELPLATWRVYATAANFHGRFGDDEKQEEFRRRAKNAANALADTIDKDDPLRVSFLAGCGAEIGR
jgi:hypothetical protein